MRGRRVTALLLGGAISLAGCNLVLGLDGTEPPPAPPPDLDGDTIPDANDNCPQEANEGQVDRDEDGFGDACDLCADLATATNHDEDLDRHGDACDVCPVHPDFQHDADKNGVGDACQYPGGIPELVFFDPFERLDAAWSTTGVGWRGTGDSVVPAARPGPADSGLRRFGDVISGTQLWTLEVGVVSTHAWRDGERFGVGLVDATGNRLATCEVVCAPGCTLFIEFASAGYAHTVDIPASVPLTRLAFHQIAGGDGLACNLDNAVGYSTSFAALPPVTGFAVLYSSPDIELTFATAYTSN